MQHIFKNSKVRIYQSIDSLIFFKNLVAHLFTAGKRGRISSSCISPKGFTEAYQLHPFFVVGVLFPEGKDLKFVHFTKRVHRSLPASPFFCCGCFVSRCEASKGGKNNDHCWAGFYKKIVTSKKFGRSHPPTTLRC